MPRTTWEPHTKHGELDTAERERLPDSAYAFPKQRKEPLTDAGHVQNALARFDQDLAFANILNAAEHLRRRGRRTGLARPGEAPAQEEFRAVRNLGYGPGGAVVSQQTALPAGHARAPNSTKCHPHF